MKVPIEGEETKNEATQAEPEVEVNEDAAVAEEAVEDEVELDDEQARVEAAIRAGEEAAEKELAADANKIREERDELAKKLAGVADEIEDAKKKAADANERYMRLQADWDNYRRRTAAERLAEKERAAEKLVCNLLPVIDDMERALEHAGKTEANEQIQTFVDGVSAVRAKMVGVLEAEGVSVIDPAGQAFDPLSHQAVGRVEDKESYDETVAQVYQKGYRMGDKVIRTAMVTVTFGGPKRPAEEAPANDEASDQDSPAGDAQE